MGKKSKKKVDEILIIIIIIIIIEQPQSEMKTPQWNEQRKFESMHKNDISSLQVKSEYFSFH
jgi:hypothetical protein